MFITKEQFDKFEDVRLSGVTNMFDIKKVEELSGLNKDEILEIMEHYTELKLTYK
jgi:hypothetical protein